MAFILFLCSYLPVNSEGSKQFNTVDSAYRVYSYGVNSAPSNDSINMPFFLIPESGLTVGSDYRKHYVYLKQSETLYLGTSYYSAGTDISVSTPSGTQTNYNVTTSSPGYIKNYLQERNGPTPLCTEGNCDNYYNPIVVEAAEEGLYQVSFFSENRMNLTEYGVTANFTSSTGIAAYDLTVTSSEGEVIPGRAFTYMHYIQ